MVVTFRLNVEIATPHYKFFKSKEYNLCVAKMVNDEYTVVWSGNHKYLEGTVFEWKEQYQVFGQNEFEVSIFLRSHTAFLMVNILIQEGGLVRATSKPSKIDFGQTCVLDSTGDMELATGNPNTSGQFKVKNEYGQICIGVNALMGGVYTPIFVSTDVVSGTGTFQPLNTVKVWFSKSQKTSTMILDWDTEGIEIPYEDTTEMSIKFDGPEGLGVWSIVANPGA
jgi:hypothetical protein